MRYDDSESFGDPTERAALVDVIYCHSVLCLATKPNNYYHAYINPILYGRKCYHDTKWTDITAAKMYTFLGILLKRSLSELDTNVYPAHFSPQKKLSTRFGIYFQTKICQTRNFSFSSI